MSAWLAFLSGSLITHREATRRNSCHVPITSTRPTARSSICVRSSCDRGFFAPFPHACARNQKSNGSRLLETWRTNLFSIRRASQEQDAANTDGTDSPAVVVPTAAGTSSPFASSNSSGDKENEQSELPPVCKAAFEGDCDQIRELLSSAGAKSTELANAANEDGWSALMWAARGGHRNAAEILLEAGADPAAVNKFGSSSLHHAAHWGHEELVELLIGETQDVEKGGGIRAVNKFGWTPLHWAGKGGHAAAAQVLIKYGADVSATHMFGNTPLHEAVNSGNVDVVEVMLAAVMTESGGDIDARNTEGETALLSAAYLGFEDIAQTLLKAGASVDPRDQQGNSPLHRAARGGHVEVVDLLLRNGADVNSAAEEPGSALHEAARWGRLEVVEALVHAGCDLEMLNKNKQTPLHCATLWARSWDDASVAEVLVKAGAKTDTRDIDGNRPVDIARECMSEDEFEETELYHALIQLPQQITPF